MTDVLHYQLDQEEEAMTQKQNRFAPVVTLNTGIEEKPVVALDQEIIDTIFRTLRGIVEIHHTEFSTGSETVAEYDLWAHDAETVLDALNIPFTKRDEPYEEEETN